VTQVENLRLTSKKSHTTDDQMRGLSAVLVDGDDVFIDNGAIHAKSRVEKGITFVRNQDEVKNGREVWCFWVTLKRREGGVQGFHAIQGFVMVIDAEAGNGYKNLPDSVNKMDRVVKGLSSMESVPDEVRTKLHRFLEQKSDLWQRASDGFREAFEV
jgi:hypothetical protein